MQCAGITKAKQPLRLATRRIPEPPECGFLLRTSYAGVCHSDLHMIKDEIDIGGGKVMSRSVFLGDKFEGTILGHEICGIVEKLGSGVGADCPLKPGDRVLIYPWIGCRNCGACKSTVTQDCEFNRAGTTDIGLGVNGGGFSSHVLVPEVQFGIKVPDSIPLPVASMLPCSGLTSYNAICKTKAFLERGVQFRGKANILIIGLGGLGLWGVLLARLIAKEMGKEIHILGMDVKQDRLDSAKAVGADETFLFPAGGSTDDIIAAITQKGERRLDAVIDFVGGPATQTVGLDVLYKGGTDVVVGLAGGTMPFPIAKVVYRAIVIQGMRTGQKHQLEDLVELVARSNVSKYPDYLLFPLSEINNIIDKLKAGKMDGRALLKFEE